MQNIPQRRPEPHEMGDYYLTYTAKVPDGNIVQILADAKNTTVAFLNSLPEETWSHRYAPGKWSVKELVQHLLDAERVFVYRALRVARRDQTPLPGFDENVFAETCDADRRSPASLIAEYEALRESSISLFKSLPDAAWNYVGTASELPFSALAAAFILAGHEIHHLGILRERYLAR